MPRARPNDEQYLRRALQLAVRGQGRVEPNPLVGCVLVRAGRVLGVGWHRRFGGPHAEVEALAACGHRARDATAYVTLEPCCHTGKTPPCTDALLAAGIARVVAPLSDPDPRVAGQGFAALRAAGVQVDVGLLAEEATRLNAPFFKRIRTGRPWVILKWAQSLDGKIATACGDARWITDEACRGHAHRTRARVDALVVGIGTVRADDPLLTARGTRLRRIATRVVLDGGLHTPLASQLVRTARNVPTLVFCDPAAPRRREQALRAAGVDVQRVRADRRAGRRGTPLTLSLPAVLDVLGARQMTTVMVEGGSQVLGSFVAAGLADECHVYIAPRLIGGDAAPGPLGGVGVARVADALNLQTAALRKLGTGWLCTGCCAAPIPTKR
jgi:diaminohydroxyphosphoribosylaminopyrimidine deaminase / 5-amino-6-(5-phosphoribosylamino)uracil reductase